jgi:GxxExxY protein
MNANEENILLFKEESYKIVGAAMNVHNVLGCGFLEAVYQDAFQVELELLNIPFEREVLLPITYKERKLSSFYKADFICYENIVIELKALAAITSDHKAQVINYLKATRFELGLLINFGTSKLTSERIIREHSRLFDDRKKEEKRSSNDAN